MFYNIKLRACLFCISVAFVFCGFNVRAQSLGDPIVNITFGSGTSSHASPLQPDSGSTTYTYSAGTPADGLYTIANTTAGMYGSWWVTTDHTGNIGGYMMIVNASYDPGIFYTRQVTALCGNTRYQFAAWVKNLNSSPGILPNITFTIETTKGVVIGTGSTNNIPTGNQWIQYPFTFTTPANVDTVVLKMTNNAPGGTGNDIAIDDITFRAYGAPVSVVFTPSGTSQKICSGVSTPLTINATTTLVSGYSQKLQLFVNGVWTDESPAGTAAFFTVAAPTAAGIYNYRVVSALAGNVSSANCVVASNVITLTVAPTPTPAFTVAAITCLGDSTAFTDLSTANGSLVNTWIWDFGDGATSVKQNPSHLYALSGDYTVKLTVTNANGCASAASAQSIHIAGGPIAAFNVSVPDCETKAVTITDQSTNTEGAITSWLWDYGDGSATETKTTAQAFQHTYTATGTYAITLVITNSNGCTSRKASSVTINPLPVVNFGIPATCRSDNFTNFTDSTTIADNSTGSLIYLWNFGDKNASAANNTSGVKNPQHHYSDTGRYVVSLTVTSNKGCAVTVSKTLTVNGAVPVAGFSVLDPASLCSSREVDFVNNSTVDYGNITRVKIYFDFAGDTSISVTDNSPYPGKIYRHLYPEFYAPDTRAYKVYMKVNSGGLCGDSLVSVITLKAVPSIKITAPDTICQGAGTVLFTATKTAGPNGTGIYTGKGISSAGLFDPTISGLGTFTIQYIYTSANACADTVNHQITVNASPTAYAGTNLVVLEGGSVKLQGSAKGDGLTYAWYPATGLSANNILNPVASPKANTTYKLTVTNNVGCTATDSVSISILKAPVIPNTFTPNGDGKNDAWNIQYLNEYPGCTVDVFNRNGQRVYWSIGYGTPWDGRYNGVNLPVGTYYYVINPKNGRGTLSGPITIVR